MITKRIILLSVFTLSMAGMWGLMVRFVPEQENGYFYQSNIDIDLNSGAKRQIHYFWIIPLKHVVSQTPFSKIASEYVEVTDKPVWKEDLTGVSILLSKRSGGGKRIYLCETIAFIIEHADTFNISPEEQNNYMLKALSFLRANNIQALEDLMNELIRKTREY